MHRRKWLWTVLLSLPVAVVSVVYGQGLARSQTAQPVRSEGYNCPLTGEELPCPRCCPLNEQK